MNKTPTATRLYRPTLHQIQVLDLSQPPAAVFEYVRNALAYLEPSLPIDAAQDLREQLKAKEQHRFSYDVRYSLLRSDGKLYQVQESVSQGTRSSKPLRAGIYAYQNGNLGVAHLVWHWDGMSNTETFIQELNSHLWEYSGTVKDICIGQGLLLTAAVTHIEDNNLSLANEIAAPFKSQEWVLTPIVLPGMTLYANIQPILSREPWTAVLLFNQAAIEDATATNEFVMYHWPLVVLYHMHVRHLYDQYQNDLVSRLRDDSSALGAALNEGSPLVLSTNNTRKSQRALTRLSSPQHRLFQAVGAVEYCALDMRQSLESLEKTLRNAQSTLQSISAPMDGKVLEAGLGSRGLNALSDQINYYVSQMNADITKVRHIIDRSTAAIGVLRTQVDIMQAGYIQVLAVVTGIIGSGLAAGQLISEDVAEVFYYDFGLKYVWESLQGYPLGSGYDGPVMSFVLCVSTGLFILATLGLLKFLFWWHTRR
jgi:hypothetical protein